MRFGRSGHRIDKVDRSSETGKVVEYRFPCSKMDRCPFHYQNEVLKSPKYDNDKWACPVFDGVRCPKYKNERSDVDG